MPERLIKQLLAEVTNNDLKELLQDHLKSMTLEEDQLTLLIDRTYALHILDKSSELTEKLEKAIDKAFGSDTNYDLIIHNPVGSEREKAIDHNIRQY